MGKRIFMISAELLVELCKRGDGALRSQRVTANPLPDDAKIVGYEIPISTDADLSIILASEAWLGDSREPLREPSITVYYGAEAILAAERVAA